MKYYTALPIFVFFLILYGCNNVTTFNDLLGNYDGKLVLGGGLPNINYRLKLSQDSTFQLIQEDGKIKEHGKFRFYDLKYNDTLKKFGDIVSSEQKSLQIIEFITVFEISPEMYEMIKDLGNPSTNRHPGDIIYSYLIYDNRTKSLSVYPRTALEQSVSAQGKLPFYLVSDDQIVFKKE